MMETNIAELIEKIRPDVERQLAEETTKRVADALSWSLQHAIGEFVGKYIKDEVLPDVLTQLQADKANIVAGLIVGVKKSCEGLGEKLAETAIKNMSSSYNLGKIVEGMFK